MQGKRGSLQGQRSLDHFLDLKGFQKVDSLAKVEQTACPTSVSRVTGAPVPGATNTGKSRVPPHPRLEQTLGTFEQRGSPVNDLWIQGVSHLPGRVARPFQCLLLPTQLCAPALASSQDPGSLDPLGGMWRGSDNVSNKETSL